MCFLASNFLILAALEFQHFLPWQIKCWGNYMKIHFASALPWQCFCQTYILLINNYLNNIFAEVIIIKVMFALAKPLAIADCRGDLCEIDLLCYTCFISS